MPPVIVFTAPAQGCGLRPLAPAGDAALVVLDLQQVKCLQSIRGMNHRTLLGELMGLLRQEMPRHLAELSHWATDHQREALASQAHALAGSCATLGGRQMHAAACALQQAAKQADWAEIATRIAEVTEAWTQLDHALGAYEQEGAA
jgi:HPt (histidine-containing phosphotransfer) domain-containing protein